MASHETTLRAVQIVENGAVSNVDVCKDFRHVRPVTCQHTLWTASAAQAWMMNLMNQGLSALQEQGEIVAVVVSKAGAAWHTKASAFA